MINVESREFSPTRSSLLDKLDDSRRQQLDQAIIDRDPPTYKSVFCRFGLNEAGVSFTAFYYYARKLRAQAARLTIGPPPTATDPSLLSAHAEIQPQLPEIQLEFNPKIPARPSPHSAAPRLAAPHSPDSASPDAVPRESAIQVARELQSASAILSETQRRLLELLVDDEASALDIQRLMQALRQAADIRRDLVHFHTPPAVEPHTPAAARTDNGDSHPVTANALLDTLDTVRDKLRDDAQSRSRGFHEVVILRTVADALDHAADKFHKACHAQKSDAEPEHDSGQSPGAPAESDNATDSPSDPGPLSQSAAGPDHLAHSDAGSASVDPPDSIADPRARTHNAADPTADMATVSRPIVSNAPLEQCGAGFPPALAKDFVTGS